MPPVRDLLDYYLSLIKVTDVFSLSFSQRQKFVLLMLHDFFSERISMIDICSLFQYLVIDSEEANQEEQDLEYVIWCSSKLISTEEQNKIYDQPRQPQSELLIHFKEYSYTHQDTINDIILDRSLQKLLC